MTEASTGSTGGARWAAMTWNLHGARGIDVTRVAEVVAAEAPDVVLVQEIRRRDTHRLAAALGMRADWALKHFPYTWFGWWRAEGMALLTRHALSHTGDEEISRRTSRRWDWHRRIAQWAVVRRGDGQALRVYNLHLSPHADAAARLSEAKRVTALVGDHEDRHGPGLAVIVGGDFNDHEDASIIAALPGIEHLSPGFTNPSEAPSQTLDHVLAPADAVDVSVSVPAGGDDWAKLSDHLPVTVRLRLP